MITPYFKDIENRVLDQIQSARSSINIAVAWFTNIRIMEALIRQMQSHPSLSVEIVVDDNKINVEHFFNKEKQLAKAGIIIRRKVSKQFLHHKFMIIDDDRVMVGSYNFTQKA